MPPPHLHPRSRMTSSLFAATLAASFLVVGIPHVLPCPAPRVTYADGDMADPSTKRRRRRRQSTTSLDAGEDVSRQQKNDGQIEAGRRLLDDARQRHRQQPSGETGMPEIKDGFVKFDALIGAEEGDDALASARGVKRACPVPKPGGKVGELLGFSRSRPGESRDDKGGEGS